MPATAPIPTTPTGRFAAILSGLQLGLRPAAAGTVAGALMMLIWNKISRIGTRFARLARMIEEGTYRPRTKPRPTPSSDAEERPKPPPPEPAQPTLPQGRKWLIRLLPVKHHVTPFASQLRTLLSDPEMQALIGQAPEAMSRVLRPLCHMLGVEPDPALLPPPRRRQRTKPPKPAKAPPEPEPPIRPRPRGLCEPPGRYAPGAWVDRVPPHWRDVLEGTVKPRRRRRSQKSA